MAEDADIAYDDTHRTFLQVFIGRGTLSFEEARPILAEILTAKDEAHEVLPSHVTTQVFNNYISSLNTAISPLDLEIRSTVPQSPYPVSLAPGAAPAATARVYALVNTTSDPITQLSTTHTADEIAYLKRVLDAMFETYNTRRAEVLSLTNLQALHLNRPPPASLPAATQDGEDSAPVSTSAAGLTKAEAERCLESLVAEGWLDLSRKGYYRLSSRALMELRSWLIEAYNAGDEGDEDDDEGDRVDRVKLCHGCKEIVIVGQRCRDLDCPVRVHDFCLRNVLRAAGGESCPTCKRAWTGDAFVGEKAATVQRRSTGGVTEGDVRRTSALTNGVDIDDG